MKHKKSSHNDASALLNDPQVNRDMLALIEKLENIESRLEESEQAAI